MSLILKTVIIVAVIAATIYYFFYKASSKLSFSFKLGSIDLSSFNLGGLLSGQTTANATVDLGIKNDNSFTLKFSTLSTQIFYGGILVAQSSQNINNFQSISALANSTVTFKHELVVYVNQNTIDLLASIRAGQQVQLSYKISLKIFGLFPYSLTGTPTIN